MKSLILAGGLLVGVLALFQITIVNASEIVIEDADTIWNATSEFSSDLINAASNVTSRVAVEYSNSLYYKDLNVSINLLNLTSNVTSRILTEYANSIYHNNLDEIPFDLENLTEKVSPKIMIEYANSNYYQKLIFPKELMNDSIPPIITNMGVDNLTSDSATINWKTNEFTIATVKYGETSGNYTHIKTVALFYKNHMISLKGLSPITTYYFRIICADLSGNTAETSEQSFTTKEPDKTPPNISFKINGTYGNNNWYISNATLILFAEDEDSGVSEFRYKLDEAWHDYVKPINLSEGIHTIKFYAEDNAGNNASDSITIKVDKTRPTATYEFEGIKEGNKYTSDVIVKITANDGLAGINQIVYKIDDENWIKKSSKSVTFTVDSNGVHTIEYYAIDNAGNLGEQNQVSFEIAKNIPPIADFYYTPLNPEYTDIISFVDNSTDEDGYIASWTWYFGDGNSSTEQNPAHKYSSEGIYKVKLIVTDNKGVSSSKETTINVADIFFISISSPSSGETWYKGGKYTITWSSKNAGDNVNIELYLYSSRKLVIASGIPNNGSHAWKIPTYLELSNYYRIKITSVDNSDLYSYSNYFEIENPVKFLNSNMKIETGKFLSIQWKSLREMPVSIYLYKENNLVTTISYNMTAAGAVIGSDNMATGHILWKVPDNLKAGKYKIKIVSVTDSNIYDCMEVTVREPWTVSLQKHLWIIIFAGVITISGVIGRTMFIKFKTEKEIMEKRKKEIIDRINKIIKGK